MSEKSERSWFATRFILWILLAFWTQVIRFQREAKQHGLLGAVLLFTFSILLIELLLRADRRLRHRRGVPWVSRLYGSMAWLTVVALVVAVWLITR